jgi:site-specific DNA-methyltransferase (adenine-specific)
MKTLEANSVDAIVTDPPYGLEFMGKAWDGFGTPLGFQTWSEQWAREAFRVLKPGGHLLAFGGTRMYHRLAAGIEDAGFEIRDTLMWLYGSGFPKSLDVSKAIDKAAGAEREVVGSKIGMSGYSLTDGKGGLYGGGFGANGTGEGECRITAPSTEAAKKWQGWGTALKPAVEPIVLARKPLIGTVAENVLTHGTGALNIDASRIGTDNRLQSSRGENASKNSIYELGMGSAAAAKVIGRWPANILLDEEAAALLDEQSGERPTGELKPHTQKDTERIYEGGWGNYSKFAREATSGGASRFFYVAKAGRAERNAGLEGFAAIRRATSYGSMRNPQCNVCGTRAINWEKRKGMPSCGHDDWSYVEQTADGKHPGNPERNIHPTVKPVDLMRYLITLVTPKGGTVLDPFMGSGTTAVAAIGEGVNWIGCEREPEYVAIIEARIAAAQPGMGLNLEEDTQ